MDRRSELEAAIDLDPYDDAAHAVLDWLHQQADPRGELAALVAAAVWDRRSELLLHDFLEAHPELVPPGRPTLRWCGAYIQRAEVHAADATELIRHPSSRFLAELAIRLDVNIHDPSRPAHPEVEPILGLLGLRPHTSLRVLELFGDRARFAGIGDVTALSRGAPRLERLALPGFATGELALPRLQQLALASFRMQPDTIEMVRRAAWPALTSFDIRPGACTNRVLDTIGESVAGAFPRLETLSIGECQHVERVLVPLMVSGAMRTLRTLALRHARLTDDHVRIMESHASAFAGLEQLDVSCNQLSTSGIARLRAFGIRVIAERQGEPSPSWFS